MRLRIRDVSAAIGGAVVLRRVEVEVGSGEVSALVGPNGAGKTTTMRVVMGFVRPSGGRVEIDGRNVTGMKPHEISGLGVGYSPEDRRLFPSLTVRENLELPIRALGLDRDRLETVLTLIPQLRELLGKRASQLSGGQQKLVALARALIVGTRVALLDEVLEGLSPTMREFAMGVVREYAKTSGAAILMAESNESYVASADSVYWIERGETRRVR